MRNLNIEKQSKWHPPLKVPAKKPVYVKSVLDKYSRSIPKRELGSPYDKHLQKSSKQIQDLKSEYTGFKMRNTKNFELRKVAKKILNP